MSEFKQELLNDVLDKETGLSEREVYFLDILFDRCQGDIPFAMKESGFPKDYPVSKLRKKLSHEIAQASRDFLAGETASASFQLVKISKDGNMPGAGNAIKAINSILDRGGAVSIEAIQAKQPNVIVILPPKVYEDDPKYKTIDYEE